MKTTNLSNCFFKHAMPMEISRFVVGPKETTLERAVSALPQPNAYGEEENAYLIFSSLPYSVTSCSRNSKQSTGKYRKA